MKEPFGISLAKRLLESMIVKCKAQLMIWCKFYVQYSFIHLIGDTKYL